MADEHDQPDHQPAERADDRPAVVSTDADAGPDSFAAAVAAEPPPTTKAPAPAPTPIWTPPPALRRNGAPKRKRISRWDRPPEPHDWRWVVGHIGRALITLGLLMFGFVAYQLWGTGIQTARAQNQLDTQFDNLFEENGIVPDTLGPPTSTTVVETAESAPGTTSVTDPPTTSGTTGPTSPTDTAAATTEPPTTAAPVEQNYGNIDPGEALLKLVIPRIDFNWKVVAGVSSKDLAKGPGHFADTPLPGQLGNSAIAGHRTGHGGPFLDLDRLQPGDEIQVYTKLGDAYVYIVTDSVVVDPSDYHVITDSDPNAATLTLVTCDPKYTSKRRLVVHATLDPTRGSPVGLPLIYYGQDEPIPVEPILPSDDTTLDTSVNTSPSTTASIASTASTATTTAVTAPGATTGSSVDSTTPIETDPAADTSTVSGGDDGSDSTPAASAFAGEDAFSQGWFDDVAAWPHVIGWAVLLAAVAYGAFRLAKRYRRLYLALLVGCVPFVVVLYFFYENVNRLLPAAI
ncbi:MAG: class E sortase [Ilumatobacteraceae bacterium]